MVLLIFESKFFYMFRNNYCNSKEARSKNDGNKSLYFGSNYSLSVLSGLIFLSQFCINQVSVLRPKLSSTPVVLLILVRVR